MSWNWSIFVFTRIYNCLITSSSNRLTISRPLIGHFNQFLASDWLMSGPDHPGESRKQCHRVQCPGFIIAAASGIWAASVTRAICSWGFILKHFQQKKNRFNSRQLSMTASKMKSSVAIVVGVGSEWGRDDVGDVDVMMRWGEMTWLLLMDHDQSGMISSCDILTSYKLTCW